jgi:hypothetical protein
MNAISTMRLIVLATCVLSGQAAASSSATAEPFVLECKPRFKGELCMAAGNREQTLRWDFEVVGEYRIDAAQPSVTINFTIDDAVAKKYNRTSRYIDDVRVANGDQIVFCENDVTACRRVEGTRGAFGLTRVTVIDLKAMTISSSRNNFYGRSGHTNETVSGPCRRL